MASFHFCAALAVPSAVRTFWFWLNPSFKAQPYWSPTWVPVFLPDLPLILSSILNEISQAPPKLPQNPWSPLSGINTSSKDWVLMGRLLCFCVHLMSTLLLVPFIGYESTPSSMFSPFMLLTSVTSVCETQCHQPDIQARGPVLGYFPFLVWKWFYHHSLETASCNHSSLTWTYTVATIFWMSPSRSPPQISKHGCSAAYLMLLPSGVWNTSDLKIATTKFPISPVKITLWPIFPYQLMEFSSFPLLRSKP